jgi:hypothetical protein
MACLSSRESRARPLAPKWTDRTFSAGAKPPFDRAAASAAARRFLNGNRASPNVRPGCPGSVHRGGGPGRPQLSRPPIAENFLQSAQNWNRETDSPLPRPCFRQARNPPDGQKDGTPLYHRGHAWEIRNSCTPSRITKAESTDCHRCHTGSLSPLYRNVGTQHRFPVVFAARAAPSAAKFLASPLRRASARLSQG